MFYKIEYSKTVKKEDIPNLSKSILTQIKRAIEERLVIDPVGFGKPLRYNLKGCRSLRVGDYRIVYIINNQTVTIIAIKHRKDVYEDIKTH